FFLQAEDGIRAFHVTGVQTCALPISTTAANSPTASASTGSWKYSSDTMITAAKHASEPSKLLPPVNGILVLPNSLPARLAIPSPDRKSVVQGECGVLVGRGTRSQYDV